MVNAKFSGSVNPAKLDPSGYCPPYQKVSPEPFMPTGVDRQIAEERIVAPGPKKRTLASIRNGSLSAVPVTASVTTTDPAPAITPTAGVFVNGWSSVSRALGLTK